MDVELNPGPNSSSSRFKWKLPYCGCRSERTVGAREATKVFNIQPAMTPRRHQFAFHSGRNDNNLVRIPLISNQPCCSSPIRFGVWNARLLKTKVSSLCDLMLSLRLDLLSVTESWLTSKDYHSRPHGFTWRLRCLSLAKIHSHRRWICCYRTQRASCFAKWRLYFFFVRTFWFNYHLWRQSFSPCDSILTSTVQEKWLYNRKVFLRILCVIRGVDCYILSIPSLGRFQLSRRCWLKCKRQTILWPFFFLLICHPLYGLIGNTPWNWSRKCEKAVCAAKCALTSAAAVLAHFDPEFPVELSVDASPYGLGVDIMHVYSNGNRRPIAYASQTLNEHDKAFSYGIRFVPSKRNAVADALSRLPLPSASNEEDATYRVEERLVHSLPITHKEIRYATQVDPVLSRALEFFKQGCPQYVEDLRLQPLFQPPNWVIGRARLSSVGASSNQPYPV